MRSQMYSDEKLTIENVVDYYEDSLEAIGLLELKVKNEEFPYPSKFIGATRQEVKEAFEQRRRELEYNANFNLIAATEAILKIDFDERVSRRGKGQGQLNNEFYKIYKEYNPKISLENHILEQWKLFKPEERDVFSSFKGLIKYRNWLAHGRYWQPELSRHKHDFVTVHVICNKVDKVIRKNK